MKRFHLIFGLLIFIAFLLSGQYMDKVYNHLQGMEDGMRLLYRTRHIFILMASLIHIGIGLYYETRKAAWQKLVQTAGSMMLVFGTLLLLFAFWVEPRNRDLKTPHTHNAMYVLLLGIALHGIASLKHLAKDTKS